MKIAGFGVFARLTTPSGKSRVKEGIGTVHGGMDTDCLAVCHVKLHHDAAAGDHIKLLRADVTETVGEL